MTRTEAEQEIRTAVANATATVFKLVVDEASITLSIDIEGEPPVRKANYVQFSPGLNHVGVNDIVSCIKRITNRGTNVRPSYQKPGPKRIGRPSVLLR
jgi:hypothetical protein